MSLSLQAIDRLFTRMSVTYGEAWNRSLGQAPINDVKSVWAHELGVFANSLTRIAWALENLPAKCPNVIEFRNLCRQAPMPEAPRLPEPKADPERVRAELAKLGDLKVKVQTKGGDGREWARSILRRYQACERINPTVLRFAREALKEAA
ncbi:hypothetical protein [Hydrogenophaga crocea]|uniref:Uncharacterized protein n=1 Tax=Hydrogenophaga crocea TaxID=2716225 RepID=A0A6G8IF03_9BURK|nr:hypothetical protein [Hydrogenophaga crocea]QIM51606.1 hypothetical protein G9Q37_05360 [Hydrogenophaga crocea]